MSSARLMPTLSPVLRRLVPEARRLLTPAFLRGERALWPADVLDGYLAEAEATARLPLVELDEHVADALHDFAPGDPALDAWLGVRVHAALPLSRRAAAEPGLWRFLTIARYPRLVRHRWGYAGRSHTANRYWHSGTRPTSNMLERLWWICEILRGPWPQDLAIPPDALENDLPDELAVARLALSRPSLAVALFSRTMSHYAPLARACVLELHDAPAARIESIMPRLRAMLSTLQLETHSEALLRVIIAELLTTHHSSSAKTAK